MTLKPSRVPPIKSGHGRAMLCLVVLLSNVGISHAQVGNVEHVMSAAIADQEPGYLNDLMDALSKKLRVIAESYGVRTPSQRLAWFHTTRAILGALWLSVSQASGNAARMIGGD